MLTNPENSVLEALSLCKGFRSRGRWRAVVEDVSVRIEAGQVVGLLGPNGAGKTTTFYMLVGFMAPDRGRISCRGEDITRLPMHIRARRGISYLPQESSVFRKLTVEENLLAILETLPLNRRERIEKMSRLLEELQIDHLAKQRAYSLSGGERRRVEIARSLVLDPIFLLLDEPFAGIDPIAVLEIQGIINRLKGQGIGVLITDHNVRETLEICDNAYILNQGKILEYGPPAAIASSRSVRSVYLGDKFSL